ncbi:type I-B CRISPR-associated protein Cas5b [Halobaculum gomorrense]|uniref:CRISPR-associated protein, Cas5h family n=1 Tax=Halobaculum gomorrense TaxID=43928 RepID=A0A1M5USR3_9EURY|nr:type I-B CRISPR-associated protein Cas5b [Halobaculum gomorrense]SHH65753.1 CRISPR-associated protein, Cas5h family [Halobaculum gomorrense]
MAAEQTAESGYTAGESVPTITDGLPDRCLVCTISGDWGHFRRVDRTVTKQTYRLPPRTTIAGLLAAIVGVGRDEYYETFNSDQSAIGIEPIGDLRTTTQPTLGLGTNPSETYDRAGGTGQTTVQVEFPDSTDNRQIHSYEYVVDPTYRVYIATEDEEFYRDLRTHLERGTSHYTPTLGLSELLATVSVPEWTTGGETTVEPVNPAELGSTAVIDSALPVAVDSVVPKPGTSHHVERLPAFMEADGGYRRTTGFADYAFTTGEELEVRAAGLKDVALGRLDGRTIAFY